MPAGGSIVNGEQVVVEKNYMLAVVLLPTETQLE